MALLKLAPNPWFLAAGVVLDLLLGDPNYAAHPVRLMGWTLTRTEKALRKSGFDGYGGGIALFFVLALVWAGGISLAVVALPDVAASLVSVFLIYSLLALRDLLRHGWDVERAATAGDVAAARSAVSKLVGRDTAKMDGAACTRAAIESLSENLTDGFVSPVFWYAVGGLPGLIVFKVVSTMDSMVGYKTERYLAFRMVRRADGRFDELDSGADHVGAARRGGVGAAEILGAQGADGGVAAACNRAGSEFGMERSCYGGCAGAAADRSDLGRRTVGDRGVVG